MAVIIGILALGAAVILQTTVISGITLLHGTADLVMLTLLGWLLHERVEGKWAWGVLAGLMIGYASHLPIWVPLIGYLLVTAVAEFMQTRVWQVHLLSLFLTTLVGTFLIQLIALVYLVISGAPLDFGEGLNLVILPSVVLNLILALPIYGLVGELSSRLYPPEVEV